MNENFSVDFRSKTCFPCNFTKESKFRTCFSQFFTRILFHVVSFNIASDASYVYILHSNMHLFCTSNLLILLLHTFMHYAIHLCTQFCTHYPTYFVFIYLFCVMHSTFALNFALYWSTQYLTSTQNVSNKKPRRLFHSYTLFESFIFCPKIQL